ncbi:hypothetical protein PGB90_006620 [Kerria lacca]
MSLQWTLIAVFLYIEIAVVIILILPLFSPMKWNRILHSNFIKTLSIQAVWYFYFILVMLVLFMLDTIREMRKYSNIELNDHLHSHLDAEMQANMRLFRAQRNFYICLFSLLLNFVIKRLLTLISTQATLIAKSEAAMKQAISASTAAKDILNQKSDAHDKEVNELKTVIISLEEKLSKITSDRNAIKSQAESLTKEYDRLLGEHRKLQESISASGDKKKE